MKVAIVGGGGRVGSCAAYALQCGSLVSEIQILDANKDLAEGEALDLHHGSALAGDHKIYAGDYGRAADSDIFLITAGLRRKPDESRLDLINRNVTLFVQSCAAMVKPGGLMIAATLNRTLKSFALAIVGAEYILRWLPVGSHRWDKFVTPNELEIAMEQGGLQVTGSQGVIYNILADRWQLSSDTDVNYMLVAEKA